VLIILPPSETKRPAPPSGPALDLEQLAFPALNPMRKRVMAALIETSTQPDALERLRVRLDPPAAGKGWVIHLRPSD
jgi:hypothetical protein